MIRKLHNMPDGRISALHYGDTSQPIRLVFANANGFNGLTYRRVLEPLGIHAVALDLRGHGMSELPTEVSALRNWHVFRDDIIYFVEHYTDSPIILAGHSFGAVSAILSAPRLKDRLVGYVGLDPVTIPWAARQWSKLPGGRAFMKRNLPIARNAGRRRYIFDSLEAAFERYKGRGAFKNIPDEILKDYLEGGLKLHKDGVQLSCHPSWEQAIFVAQGHNLFKALPSLPANAHIIYGGKSAVSTPLTRRAVQKRLNGGKVDYRSELHHLFPLHEPAFTTGILEAVIDAA